MGLRRWEVVSEGCDTGFILPARVIDKWIHLSCSLIVSVFSLFSIFSNMNIFNFCNNE